MAWITSPIRRLLDVIDGGAPPHQRHYTRRYEAAGAGGRWNASAHMGAPASSAHAAGQTVAARVAYSVANSPHAAAIVLALVNNAVGDGPSFRPVRSVPIATAYLSRFWPQIDVEGGDLGQLLQRVVRCWVIHGEAFVLMLMDPDTGTSHARLINAEQIDRTLTHEFDEGGRITQGIETDVIGRIVAYHVLPDPPDLPFAQSRPAVRIPATDILHLYDPQHPGQRRGVSMLAPVLARLAEIDRLEDAQLATANTQALMGLVFKTTGGDFGALADQADPQFPTMEPGASIVAPPGYDVEAFKPANMDGGNDFLKAMNRSAAAGVGVPYALMTGDLSDTNYSSARLGLLEFRRRIISIQRNLLVPRILDPLWTRWATLEQMAGRLEPGDVSGEWVFPGWAQIDPLKETEADAAAIGAGIKSRFEVIATRGRDPQAVDAEIAEDAFQPHQESADA